MCGNPARACSMGVLGRASAQEGTPRRLHVAADECTCEHGKLLPWDWGPGRQAVWQVQGFSAHVHARCSTSAAVQLLHAARRTTALFGNLAALSKVAERLATAATAAPCPYPTPSNHPRPCATPRRANPPHTHPSIHPLSFQPTQPCTNLTTHTAIHPANHPSSPRTYPPTHPRSDPLTTPQHVAARLHHRYAMRALNRWREYAAERVELRAKAQAVLKHLLLRRLYAGFW